MKNLDELFSQVADAQEPLVAATERRALVRRRLENSSLHAQARTSRLRAPSPRQWAFGVTVLVGIAFGLGVGLTNRPKTLTAVVASTGTAFIKGGWVDAPEAAAVPIRFSDGTKVDVAPKAKLRLLELGERGAKLSLESGRARVEVAHGESRLWLLSAGPFLVHVTGTRFDFGWNPKDDQFDLILSEGQVEIAGCGFGEGRKLVAGQTVKASCREGSVHVAYDGAPPDAPLFVPASTPTAAPSAVPSPQLETLPTREPRSPPSGGSAGPPGAMNWQQLAKLGRYGEALAEAHRRGFELECARNGPGELALLGEAAQRAQEPKRARQAWLALRKRFPGAPQAAVAAFSLGVMEFDQLHSSTGAAGWFRTYLRENPSGPLRREARGRLLEALQSSDGEELRMLAADYLRDYPVGPHAALARRVLNSK